MVMIFIPEPRFFHCEPDEEVFFQWLYELPTFENVIGTPTGLELYLTKIDKITLYELIALLFRYGLDKKCLKILCEEHEDKSFRDPKNYWYAEIFGK